MKTIDLDLAKELQSVCKEKNITMPRAFFYHYKTSTGYEVSCMRDEWEAISPAYTLDELLEWLPHRIKHEEHKKYYFLEMAKYNNGYNFIYQVFDSYMDDTYYEFHKLQEYGDSNPANAACKLLIWLIKENLL